MYTHASLPLYCYLPGLFFLKRSPRGRRPQQTRRESGETRHESRGRGKGTCAAVFFNGQNVLTNEIGHRKRRGERAAPLRLHASVSVWIFPTAIFVGCVENFQIPALAVVPHWTGCLPVGRLMRLCCPECRLPLSSGRLGIEPSTQYRSVWQLLDEGGGITWDREGKGERERVVVSLVVVPYEGWEGELQQYD